MKEGHKKPRPLGRGAVTHWQVGMKAKCVAENGIWHKLPRRWHAPITDLFLRAPRKGQILIVRRIYMWNDYVALVFSEFPGEGYDSTYFRPLVDTHTDISIFTKILHDVNHRQHEPAANGRKGIGIELTITSP